MSLSIERMTSEDTCIVWYNRAEQMQSKYCICFRGWNYFDHSHEIYIKSQVGLILFGTTEDAPDNLSLHQYYRFYSEDKKEVIENIYGLILNRRQGQYIQLSSTYLVCRLENGKEFTCPLIRVYLEQSNIIHFYDEYGRFYSNWETFIDSNRLPACKFMVPRGGTYSPDSTFVVYESRAAKIGKLEGTFNGIVNGVSLGCMGLSTFAIAPAFVLPTMVGVELYNVVQSIRTLRDRESHGQSIAPNNTESAFAYGAIAASALSGVSLAAIKNISKIKTVFGSYANAATTAVKALNLATLIVDSGLFLLNVREFYLKARSGMITSRDAFDLTLQIFLMCGAIVQVRDMHRALKNSNNMIQNVQKTAKTNSKKNMKRKLQRKRAKARARENVVSTTYTNNVNSNDVAGTDVYTSVNSNVVAETDVYTSVKAFALRSGSFGVNVLMMIMPRQEIIYNYFSDLRDLINSLLHGHKSLKDVAPQLFYHVRNLYTIIVQDVTHVTEILRRILPNMDAISNSEHVALIFNNQIDRVHEATERIAEDILSNDDTEVDYDENNSKVTIQGRDEIILTLVLKYCSKYSTFSTSEGLIKYFHDVMIFCTEKLFKELIDLYDSSFNICKNNVGEDRAKRIMASLGKRSENEFYPGQYFFDKVIKDIEKPVEEFAKAKAQWSEGHECADFLPRVLETLISFERNIHSQIFSGEVNNLGINRLCQILQTTSSVVTSRLKEALKKNNVRCLYRESVEILQTVRISVSEIDIFQSALSVMNNDELIKLISFVCNNIVEQPVGTILSVETAFNKKAIDEIIAEISAKLYEHTMEYAPAVAVQFSRSTLFIKAFCFMAKKFITEMKRAAAPYYALKDIVLLVGPKAYKSMVKAIGLCDGNDNTLFQEKAELFARQDYIANVSAEFEAFLFDDSVSINNGKIFESIIREAGFITYKIDCDSDRPVDEYISLAESLFEIDIGLESGVKIMKTVECVFIEHNCKIITFTFIPDDKSAIVVMSDLNNSTSM